MSIPKIQKCPLTLSAVCLSVEILFVLLMHLLKSLVDKILKRHCLHIPLFLLHVKKKKVFFGLLFRSKFCISQFGDDTPVMDQGSGPANSYYLALSLFMETHFSYSVNSILNIQMKINLLTLMIGVSADNIVNFRNVWKNCDKTERLFCGLIPREMAYITHFSFTSFYW